MLQRAPQLNRRHRLPQQMNLNCCGRMVQVEKPYRGWQPTWTEENPSEWQAIEEKSGILLGQEDNAGYGDALSRLGEQRSPINIPNRANRRL